MTDISDTEPSSTILIVDDDRTNLEVASAFLENEGYAYDTALNGKLALEAAFTNHYDLILLDINMPEMDGFETIARLKKDSQTKEIPVIFLTAMDDIDTVTKAFSSGGVDYIRKPFNGLELLARVKTHLDLRTYMIKSIEKQHRLAQLAAIDPVTKVSNRLRYTSELRTMIANQERFALILISIDDFTRILDEHGFEGGDRLLARVAAKISTKLKDGMLIARLYGGDFVILLPSMTIVAGTYLAAKIVQSVANEKTMKMPVKCTAAVESFREDDNEMTLKKRLEKKLSVARESGRKVSE